MARALVPRKIHRYRDEAKATAVKLSKLQGEGCAAQVRATRLACSPFSCF